MHSTKTQILDIAEKLAKQRGYNAFSYRDISEVIGIKTAAIHYHFPAKDDLAVALIERYEAKFADLLVHIESVELIAFRRLELLFQQLIAIAGSQADFCLCGMLLAHKHSLSRDAHVKLDSFFCLVKQWLEKTLQLGMQDGSIAVTEQIQAEALSLIAIIEGAMLIARVRQHYLEETLNFALYRLFPK